MHHPRPWCEAHHTTYWSHGGPTNTDNGTLLCTHHHHLIHKEQWTIHMQTGIPWFIPPPHPTSTPNKHPAATTNTTTKPTGERKLGNPLPRQSDTGKPRCEGATRRSHPHAGKCLNDRAGECLNNAGTPRPSRGSRGAREGRFG
ncbi:HNH endonuclease signature motif containing protein [Arthrobacter sp. KBS0703]|uniref:HNH endonuclease signature motif containing protein n=1 Tax=Arthrobacter sp. KBS0703 TaxID=1955698 RepID=UPI0037C0D4D7